MAALQEFRLEEINDILNGGPEPCVSLYIPTEKAGRETLQGPIHLKNLLSEAESGLKNLNVDEKEIKSLLDSTRQLIDDFEFWQHQDEGLAIFLSKTVRRAYQLPISVPLRASVEEHFDIVPLLPLLSIDGHFFILTLAEDEVKLFDATRFGIQELKVKDMPTSMAEALYADQKELQLQWHSRAGSDPNRAGRKAMYHGTGDGTGMEEHKTDLKRFFDKVDAALASTFKNSKAPVVLAGVEYLLPIYREANTSATILEGEIHGNQEHRTPKEIHTDAWPHAEPFFEKSEKEAKLRFQELASKDQATDDIKDILLAAENGRVDTLFITHNDGRNGTGKELAALNGSLSRAAIETLSKSGTVYSPTPENMPSKEPVAAIFRY